MSLSDFAVRSSPPSTNGSGFSLYCSLLNPQSVNLAYDVLEPNIFMENGKLMGLKVYPHQP